MAKFVVVADDKTNELSLEDLSLFESAKSRAVQTYTSAIFSPHCNGGTIMCADKPVWGGCNPRTVQEQGVCVFGFGWKGEKWFVSK